MTNFSKGKRRAYESSRCNPAQERGPRYRGWQKYHGTGDHLLPQVRVLKDFSQPIPAGEYGTFGRVYESSGLDVLRALRDNAESPVGI